MNRYIALLRGINISGRNIISMSDLKFKLVESGFEDIVTYLNSGNIVFSADECTEIILADRIRGMIQEQFELDIPVFVIVQDKLKELLDEAPEWWGKEGKEIYDNLIFVIPPATADYIAESIGEPTKELEQILICQNTIFWSFNRKKYNKANWWKKTASVGIGEMLTIRTANTLRKISGM